MATSLNSVIVGLILSGTGFDALTKAVTKNGFEDWAALAALGTKGFDTYVEGGAVTVDKALKESVLLIMECLLFSLQSALSYSHFSTWNEI